MLLEISYVESLVLNGHALLSKLEISLLDSTRPPKVEVFRGIDMNLLILQRALRQQRLHGATPSLAAVCRMLRIVPMVAMMTTARSSSSALVTQHRHTHTTSSHHHHDHVQDDVIGKVDDDATECRHASSEGSSNHHVITPELIPLECITIELAEHVSSISGAQERHHHQSSSSFQESEGVGAPTSSSGAAGHDVRSRRWMQQQPFTDVTTIDPFAKGKLTNYIRRHNESSSSQRPVRLPALFTVVEESTPGGQVCYRCTVNVPLPHPHRVYTAEGLAENDKDAEHLAAMHGERIIDALGVHLFRLPAMQTKHAETARRAGRYAPLPADPMKPEGTLVPPPLRMVSWSTSSNEPEHGSGAFATTTCSSPGRLFSREIREAEIVSTSSPSVTSDSSGGGSGKLAESDRQVAESSGLEDVLSGEADTSNSAADDDNMYAKVACYPWLQQQTCSPPPTANKGSVLFDPTEGGQWQLVNTVSSRFSPSDVAILLPCILDKLSQGRIEEWLLHRDGALLKDRVTVKHVAPAAGFSARMFVAEINLNGLAVAKGKAQDKDLAIVLACMHAELIIDALGIPLFLKDSEKQQRHAVDVIGFGRWAVGSDGGGAVGRSGASKRGVAGEGGVVPQPLKQQIGGDEVWLDPSSHRSHKSPSERLVQSLNDVNNYVSDFIEVLPPQDLLTEARALLSQWQWKVARNPSPELFMCTRMGDYVRASILLPVPRHYGTRGANAVGRTVEQAKDLCALHALDVLCALGVPILLEQSAQDELMRRRSVLGLITTADAAVTCLPWEMEQHYPRHKTLGGGGGGAIGSNTIRPPHVPGYFTEGNNIRSLPRFPDVSEAIRVQQNLSNFELIDGMTEEAIIAYGNDIRTSLQLYFKRILGPSASCSPSIFITGYGKQTAVNNVAFLQVPLPTAGEMKEISIDLDSSPSLRSSLACPTGAYVLAVGASLKKKDAERACFLHAAKILRSLGVDVEKEKSLLLSGKKKPAATPSPGKTTVAASSATPSPVDKSGASASSSDSPSIAPSEPIANPDSSAIKKTKVVLPKPQVHPLMYNHILGTNASSTSPSSKPLNSVGSGGANATYRR